MLNQAKTENPTGAGKKQALRMTFDIHVTPEFHGWQRYFTREFNHDQDK